MELTRCWTCNVTWRQGIDTSATSPTAASAPGQVVREFKFPLGSSDAGVALRLNEQLGKVRKCFASPWHVSHKSSAKAVYKRGGGSMWRRRRAQERGGEHGGVRGGDGGTGGVTHGERSSTARVTNTRHMNVTENRIRCCYILMRTRVGISPLEVGTSKPHPAPHAPPRTRPRCACSAEVSRNESACHHGLSWPTHQAVTMPWVGHASQTC